MKKIHAPEACHDCESNARTGEVFPCPLHADAPELLTALKKAQAVIIGTASIEEKAEARRMTFDAILLAEGK